jgi:preprotein translocase SecE subunit
MSNKNPASAGFLFDLFLFSAIIKGIETPPEGVLNYFDFTSFYLIAHMNYLRKTYAEMKNVVWPSRNHIMWFTVLVVIISLLVAYYLGAFDILFTKLLGLLV